MTYDEMRNRRAIAIALGLGAGFLVSRFVFKN